MTKTSFSEQLQRVNQQLKAAKVGVTISQKGDRLYVRGTFPPKPGSTKTKAHQQDIALKIRANPQGLQRAKAEAIKIGGALALKEFDWSHYLPQASLEVKSLTVAEEVAALKTEYFHRRQRSPTTERSWRTNYDTFFKRLPQAAPLTLKVLIDTIHTVPPDSCSRSRMCCAFAALASHADLNTKSIELLRGNYSSKDTVPRDLPSDEEILEWAHAISDPRWRQVYGLMATYGLRPHEVFYLDDEELRQGGVMLTVLDGTKTGRRQAFPLHEEWVEYFDLRNLQLPEKRGRNNSQIGNTVSNHFRAAGIPFPPYHLRHCWAVRAHRSGLDVVAAARWMGHGVSVHTQTYHKWISEDVEQQIYAAEIEKISGKDLSPRILETTNSVVQRELPPTRSVVEPAELISNVDADQKFPTYQKQGTQPSELVERAVLPTLAKKSKSCSKLTDGEQLDLWGS